jgi:hypothetical protein
MAIPTTLLAHYKQQESQFTKKKSAAEKSLQGIDQVSLPAARKTSDDLTARAADLRQKIAALRQAITQAPTRGDQDALTLKLEKALVDLRSVSAAQLDAQRTIASLTQAQASHGNAVNALTAAIAASKAAQENADLREKRIKATTDSFSEVPLDPLGADVTAALAGVAAADARIKGDVPAELLERALDRRKRAVQVLQDANTAVSAAKTLSSNKLRQTSVEADTALFTFASQASSRLEASRLALESVAKAETAPLTPEEKARLADADLVAAGKTAIAAEKKRDDATAELSAKQAQLDDAILQALNADLDVDISTVKAVTDATKARDDAQKALNTAVTAFSTTMQDDLHRWEAALPEANWDLVHQLEEAKATLKELQDASLSKMTAAITAAEKAWVAELFAADKKARTALWIDVQVKDRSAAQEFENNANRQRRLTALRGDL